MRQKGVDSRRVSGESLAEGYGRLANEALRRPIVDLELRALDVLLASLFLIAALPVVLLISLAIVVTSGLPVFYRGARVGRGGQVFRMVKFRTLRRGAEERLGPYLGPDLVERTKAETTALGRWLRAAQIDEIPQLWNVARGDM